MRAGTPLRAEQVLGVLQHYGYATPLLDFTIDLRIAAAFACRRSGQNVAHGAIYKVNAGDCEDLLATSTTALGRMVRITADEVPRIRAQKSVFFSSFKSLALDRFTALTKYSFAHGSDSDSFCRVAELSNEMLFPRPDELEEILRQAHLNSTVNSEADMKAGQTDAVRQIMTLVLEDASFTLLKDR